MTHPIFDRLMVALDVAVEAFAICEVKRGIRLVARPKNAIEVHYVLAGTMHLLTPGADPIICGAGSLVVIPPRTPQTIAADGSPARNVVGIESCTIARDGMLLFDAADGGTGDLRMVCGAISASVSGSYGLLDGVNGPIVEKMDDLGIVRSAYATMLAEVDQPGMGSRALTSALMKSCLTIMLRRHFSRVDAEPRLLGGLSDPRLGKAVTTILDRPADHHSVAKLAAKAGMSRSAFARDFIRALGQSPMEFVTRTRLHNAAFVLRSTGVPIKAVAAGAGFASRSHFSRAFRNVYGLDPSAYRKSGRQD
jgi:AraC family transcriptional regulator, activator of mtrCDE